LIVFNGNSETLLPRIANKLKLKGKWAVVDHAHQKILLVDENVVVTSLNHQSSIIEETAVQTSDNSEAELLLSFLL
jgi:hypothetical protein